MRRASEIMLEAVKEHRPKEVFVGFSGGTDSQAVSHWVMTNIPSAKCFHANTGIGVEQTRKYVRETCAKFGWPLVEIRAKEDCGQDYDELVLDQGFPGPPQHRKMYNRLKERCVRELVRRHKSKRSDRILIATGIRHDESRIRAGYADRVVNREGAHVWVNPIYWWSGSDKAAYLRQVDMPVNPVAQTLGMSGECLCGAFASRGELALVRTIDPDVADRIDALEQRCRAKGFDWGWEEGKTTRKKAAPVDAEREQPMCVSCNKAGRERYA